MDTKKRIIRLLTNRTIRMAEIAREIKKNPTTISQHLKELMGQGLIECFILVGRGGTAGRYYRARI